MTTTTCKDSVLELSTRFGLSEILERVYDLIDVHGTGNDQLITELESALENAIQAALALEAQYEDLTPGGAFEAIRQVKLAGFKTADLIDKTQDTRFYRTSSPKRDDLGDDFGNCGA